MSYRLRRDIDKEKVRQALAYYACQIKVPLVVPVEAEVELEKNQYKASFSRNGFEYEVEFGLLFSDGLIFTFQRKAGSDRKWVPTGSLVVTGEELMKQGLVEIG